MRTLSRASEKAFWTLQGFYYFNMHADLDDPWMTLVTPLGKIHLHAARISHHAHVPPLEQTPLSPLEKQRAQGLVGEKKREYVLTRIWLRTLIGAALEIAPAEVELSRDPQGKPMLLKGGLHFNWSHSHDACVFAWSRTARLGVDIEFHRDPWPVNLAERYFADGEKALLKGEDPVHAGTTFFRLWSRKEAYYKCAGGAFLGGALSLDLRPHRVGDVMLWDLQGPFAAEGHSLGLAAMAI